MSDQIVHLQIDMDGSRAEKAWKRLIQSIEADEAQLAEMRKKNMQDTDEYKQVQERLKLTKAFRQEIKVQQVDLAAEIEHIATQSLSRLDSLARGVQKKIASIDPTKEYEKLVELSRYQGIISREKESRQQLQQQLSQRTAEAIIRESHLTQEQIVQESVLGSAYRTAQQDRIKFEQKIQTLTDSHIRALEKEKSMNIDIADLERQRAEVAAKVTQLSVARDAEVTRQLYDQEMLRVNLEHQKQNLQQQRTEKEQKYNDLLKSQSEVEQRIANYQQQIAIAESKKFKADTWHQALGEAQTLLTGIKGSLTDTNAEIGTIDRSIAATNTEYQKSLDETRQLHTQLTLINTTEQDIEREEKKLADMRKVFAKATMEEQIQMQASIREQDQLVQKLKQNYNERIEQQKRLEEATTTVVDLEKQIADLQAKKPKNADEAKYQKRLATLNQSLEEAKQTEAAAKQAFDNIVAGATAAGNAFQLPHDHLKRLRDELQHVINNSTDKSAIEQWSLELAEMDATLRRMELAPVRDLNVVLAEVGNAKSITQMTMLSDELKKIFDRLKDPELRNQAKAAFEGLDASIAQTKLTMRDQEQIMQEYAHAQELVRQGTSANAEEVRRHIAVMRECEASDKIDLATKQQIAGSIRQLDSLYKENNTTTMTAAEAEAAFNRAQTLVAQGATAKASEIREANRQMKEAVLVADLSIEEQNRYAQMEKTTADLMAGKIAVTMNAAQAEQVLLDTTHALSAARQAAVNGTKLEADLYLRLRDSVQQALRAQGLTIEMRNQLMASDRELEQLLRAENVTTMSQAEAEQVLAEAKQRLVNIDQQEVSVITNLIQQLTLARNAKGIEIAQSREMAEVQKLMQDAMTKTEKKYMDLAEAEKVAANASLYDKNIRQQALEALKHYAQDEKDLARRTELTEKYKQLDAAIRRLGQTSKDAFNARFVKETMSNIKTAPVADLEKALKMVQNRLKELDQGTKAWLLRWDQMQRIQRAVNNANQSLGKVNNTIKSQADFIDKAASKLLSYIGIFGGFYFIRQQLQQAFQANLKYADSLTNIQKTTQLTSEAVEHLADNIKGIDSRTSLQGLTDLAYAAGKLGVKGVADVMAFVRAADQINIALGEQLNGAESVEQLMKITNIMGTTDEHGLQDALLKTGSAINFLTMNSQATAQPMVDFMKRIAGVSTLAGVTTSELVGLAGAVNALGQPVEMSATSLSKIFVQISKNSKKVIEALKMDTEEATKFMYDISTGRMTEALLTVLQKAREAGGLSHLGLIAKDLGSEGQRVIQTLATMSENYDVVAKMVRMSNKAFEEGTSVTEEYNLKNQNAAALWERLKNQFSKITVSSDATKWLQELLYKLQDLPEAFRHAMSELSVWRTVLDNIVWLFTKGAFVVEAFIKVLSYRLVLQFSYALGKLLVTTALLTGSFLKSAAASVIAIARFRSLGVAIRFARVEMLKFNAASMKNALMVLATIGVAIYEAWTSAKRAAQEFDEELQSGLQKAKSETQDEAAKINTLVVAVQEATNGTIKRTEAINELNNQYGAYLQNLLNDKMTNEEIADAMARVNAQMKMKSILEAQSESAKNIRSSFDRDRGDLREKIVNVIANGMASPDLATAADLANSFIDQIPNILIQNTKYNRKAELEDSWLNREESRFYTSSYKSGSLLNRLSGIDMKSLDASFFTDLSEALRDYANKTHLMESRMSVSNELYSGDAKSEAKKAVELFGPQAQKALAETVNGKSLQETITRSWSGNTITGYATTEDADRYADDKKTMSSAERNTEIDALKKYIGFANEYVQDLKLIDEKQYEQESIMLSNARTRLKILTIGQIEDPEDKSSKVNRQAKDEYSAIMDLIKAYYANQENVLQTQYNQGKISQTQLEMMREMNTREQNMTEGVAREAIVRDGKVESGKFKGMSFEAAWQKRLEEMFQGNINPERNPYILRLLQQVGNMRNVGIRAVKGKDNEELTKWVNDLRNEAAKNYLNVESADSKRFLAVQQALLEYDKTGKVMNQYADTFQRLGIMFADLTKRAEGSSKSLRQITRDVMGNYVKLGEQLYRFDINSDEGVNNFRRSVIETIAETDEERKRLNQASVGEIKLLYYETFNYYNEWLEARRKADADAEKISKDVWARSAFYIRNQAEQTRNNLIKAGVWQHSEVGRAERTSNDEQDRRRSPRNGVYGNNAFMQEFGPDMELENYRLKVEASEEYVRQLMREGASVDRVRAAEIAADAASMEYVKRLAATFKQKQDAILSLTNPINDFASAMGSAWALMIDGAEGGKQAIKDATRDMIKAMIKQTFEMTQQYLQRRIMQSINDYLVSKQMRRQAAEEEAITRLKEEHIIKIKKEAAAQGVTLTDEDLQTSADKYIERMRKSGVVKQETDKVLKEADAYNKYQEQRENDINERVKAVIGPRGISVDQAKMNGQWDVEYKKQAAKYDEEAKKNKTAVANPYEARDAKLREQWQINIKNAPTSDNFTEVNNHLSNIEAYVGKMAGEEPKQPIVVADQYKVKPTGKVDLSKIADDDQAALKAQAAQGVKLNIPVAPATSAAPSPSTAPASTTTASRRPTDAEIAAMEDARFAQIRLNNFMTEGLNEEQQAVRRANMEKWANASYLERMEMARNEVASTGEFDVASAGDGIMGSVMSGINAKAQDLMKAYDEAVAYLEDMMQVAINGATRAYQKRFGGDDTESKIEIPATMSYEGSEYGLAPDTFYGERKKDSHAGRYLIPENINLSNVTLGYRNRGDFNPIETEGAVATSFHPFAPYAAVSATAKEGQTFMGIDAQGRFKVGGIENFAEGDMLARTFANNVVGFKTDENGKQVWKNDAKHGNNTSDVPVIQVLNGDGTLTDGAMNVLVRAGSDDMSKYGSLLGGRAILQVGEELRLVSGSLNDIKAAFEDIKTRHNADYVTVYTLDNGSYNRALRTDSGTITSEDLRKYDNQNLGGGGNFLYLKGEAPKAENRFREVQVAGANMRTEKDQSYQEGHSLTNERKAIVLHYTADESHDNMRGVTNTFTNPKSELSAHVGIDYDGTRYIYVPTDRVAFHAGSSEWRGRDNVNDFALGVEFQGNTWKKPLTQEQIDSFVEWSAPIIKENNIPLEDIVSHMMIAPGRKKDLDPTSYQMVIDALKKSGIYYKKEKADDADENVTITTKSEQKPEQKPKAKIDYSVSRPEDAPEVVVTSQGPTGLGLVTSDKENPVPVQPIYDANTTVSSDIYDGNQKPTLKVAETPAPTPTEPQVMPQGPTGLGLVTSDKENPAPEQPIYDANTTVSSDIYDGNQKPSVKITTEQKPKPKTDNSVSRIDDAPQVVTPQGPRGLGLVTTDKENAELEQTTPMYTVDTKVANDYYNGTAQEQLKITKEISKKIDDVVVKATDIVGEIAEQNENAEQRADDTEDMLEVADDEVTMDTEGESPEFLQPGQHYENGHIVSERPEDKSHTAGSEIATDAIEGASRGAQQGGLLGAALGGLAAAGQSTIDQGVQAGSKALVKAHNNRAAKKEEQEQDKQQDKQVKKLEKVEKKKEDIRTESSKAQSKTAVAGEQIITEATGKLQAETGKVLDENLNKQSQAKAQAAQKNANTTIAEAQVKTTAGAAEGAAETIGQLGWWGIPLVAAIQAVLSGLMSLAMGALNSAFGSNSKADTKPNAKLVSGMLTYDRGNLQSFRAAIQARTFDRGGDLFRNPGIINMVQDAAGTWVPEYMQSGKLSVFGDDGKMYNAVEQAVMQTGLITQPTLTGIGGAPALVGERGPEMVIGRETTQALMTDFPAILKFLTDYDANHSKGFAKTFDSGNLSDFSAALSSINAGGNGSADTEQLQALLESNQQTMQQMAEVNAMLVAQLQKGIKASINKYGAGGLIDEVASGFTDARKLGYNQNVNRLFAK